LLGKFFYIHTYIYTSVIILYHDVIYICVYAFTYLSARQVFLYTYFIFFFPLFHIQISVCIYTSLFAANLSMYACIFHHFSFIMLCTYSCMHIHIFLCGKSFYIKIYDSIFTILYTDFCVYIHIALRGKSFHICIYTHFIIIIIFIVLYTYFIWSSSRSIQIWGGYD
jgi:hypothetical protein